MDVVVDCELSRVESLLEIACEDIDALTEEIQKYEESELSLHTVLESTMLSVYEKVLHSQPRRVI